MDEPFGALDPVTRSALQQEMLRIHQVSGCTIVLVTHDIDEALTLADNIVLLHDGEIVQQGKPLTLLTRPGNDFVRDFLAAVKRTAATGARTGRQRGASWRMAGSRTAQGRSDVT